jgi:hypothetical protein
MNLQGLIRAANDAADTKERAERGHAREVEKRVRKDAEHRSSDAYVDEILPQAEKLVRAALEWIGRSGDRILQITPKPCHEIDGIEVEAWGKALRRLGFEDLQAERKMYVAGGDDGWETILVVVLPRLPKGDS